MGDKLKLKLLVDTKARRVLFAEVGKEVVDFLFNLLVLPVSTVVSLCKGGMVGCIRNVYECVNRMDHTYLQTRESKDQLLCPKIMFPSTTSETKRLLPCTSHQANNVEYYRCNGGCYSNCLTYVTNRRGISCPAGCRNAMTVVMKYVDPQSETKLESGEEGYVKGVVTYMVMDDLRVSPMSTISSITLLNEFDVKDVSVLQEKTVEMGMEEGLKLLEASFKTTTVLTNVFL